MDDELRSALDRHYHHMHAASTDAAAQSGNRPWVKPVESNALAVHPDDVEAAREDARKCGVPVDFRPDGTPVFTSARQMREYAKRQGYRHRGY